MITQWYASERKLKGIPPFIPYTSSKGVKDKTKMERKIKSGHRLHIHFSNRVNLKQNKAPEKEAIM